MLYEKIIEVRKTHGETQEEFARKLNISLERLVDIETGRSFPNVKELWTLVQKYDKNMNHYMEGVI